MRSLIVFGYRTNSSLEGEVEQRSVKRFSAELHPSTALSVTTENDDRKLSYRLLWYQLLSCLQASTLHEITSRICQKLPRNEENVEAHMQSPYYEATHAVSKLRIIFSHITWDKGAYRLRQFP